MNATLTNKSVTSVALIPFLKKVPAIARRFWLDTNGVQTNLSMLRGVWGLALKSHEPQAYREVFEGGTVQNDRKPHYILRPGPISGGYPSVEFLVFGNGTAFDANLIRAWKIAEALGLGPDRRPFMIVQTDFLNEDGDAVLGNAQKHFNLSQVSWPLAGDPENTPCRIRFDLPLRIIRQGRLIERPALADLVQAGFKRLSNFLPPEDLPGLAWLRDQALVSARTTVCEPFVGRSAGVVRYSGRQKVEVEMDGVVGELGFPNGLGCNWRILAAAQWLHLGKTTILGLGRPIISEV